MRRIIAVLGYGSIETEWMREQYIPSVLECLAGIETDLVVLCGGKTSASVDESEARFLGRLLQAERPGFGVPVLYDELSITTIQNLEAFARVLREQGALGVGSVQIFCASSHERKVRALAERILGIPVEDIVVSGIHGRSTSARRGRLNKFFQNWVACPLEILALEVPKLRHLLEARRRWSIERR